MRSLFNLFNFLIVVFLIYTQLLNKNFNNFLVNSDDMNKVNIYLKTSTEKNEVEILIAQLKKDYKFEFKIIDKNESINEFQKSFGDYSKNILSIVDIEDLIPQVVELNFNSESEKDSFLKSSIKTNELIEDVSDLSQWSQKMINIRKIIERYILGTSLGLLGVIAFMTFFFIKIIILYQRKEIEIQSLFGRSYQKIYFSLIKQLWLDYLVVLTTAFIFAWGSFSLVSQKLSSQKEMYYISDRISFLSTDQTCLLFVALSFLFAITSFLVLKQQLKQIYNND